MKTIDETKKQNATRKLQMQETNQKTIDEIN